MAEPAYTVLIEGVLPFNKYTRKLAERVVCSTTLVEAGGLRIIIDPGMWDEPLLEALRARGLSPRDIDMAFITHFHGDHYQSLRVLPDCEWLASSRELNAWRGKVEGEAARVLERIKPAPDRLAPGVRLLATPGHTAGHTAVLLARAGEIVAVVGDAIFTPEFLEHREPSQNAVDWEQARASLDLIASIADVVVFGHAGPARI